MREIFSKAAKITFFSSKRMYLLLILISILPSASCFDIDISPKEICCGDQITVTISITNSDAVTVEGHIELEIVDANENRNALDGLNGIVLQPGESEDFETRIRPGDCTSFGKYEVIANFVGDNCYLWNTASSKFIVSGCDEPEPKPRSSCTDEYGCKNNVVRRLCRDENGDEYWKTVDDCNDYNPPRECINGKCVEIAPLCDQDECEEKSGPVGESYFKNGALYQKFKDCDCVSNSCQCKQVEKRVPCKGVISGGVVDADGGWPMESVTVNIGCGDSEWLGKTDANGAFKSSKEFCHSTEFSIICDKNGYATKFFYGKTDEKGNAVVTIPLAVEKPECSGVVSGYIKDARTGLPISASSLLICPNGRDCWSPPPVDSVGLYSSGEKACPSATYEITCSAEGYMSETRPATTDSKGNARQDFALKSDCQGKISGHVFDANTRSPLPGAVLLICQQGEDCWSPPPLDSVGVYNTEEKACQSTTYEITCSAEGYKSKSINVTSDEKGNAWQDFSLESECSGKISGHVSDANSKSPIPGAVVLICQERGDCWSTPPVDSEGIYSTNEQACPSIIYEITCSAEGYKSESITITTDEKGNKWQDFTLEPECSGTISGKVLDSLADKPIPDASLLICQNGKCLDPIITDASGQFSLSRLCPSASYDITCSAEGYETREEKGATKDDGSSLREIQLEPEHRGTISGKVLDASNDQPIPDANLLICQNGKCFDPVVTDPSGQYSLQGFHPSTGFDITCSAEGYETQEETGTTDDKGDSVINISLQSKSLEDVKFRGTFVKGGADETTQAISFYKFDIKITEILEDPKKLIKIGDLAQVNAHRDCQAKIDSANNGDTVEVFGKCIQPLPDYQASVDLGKSPSDGAGYYLIKVKSESKSEKLAPELAIKVGTDKMGYKVGEEVTINYEISSENAGRRIKVTEQGTQASPFNFGENTFSREKSGTLRITLDKPGTYEVKLEAWIGKEKKECKCELRVYLPEEINPKVSIPNNAPLMIKGPNGSILTFIIKVENKGTIKDEIVLSAYPENTKISLSKSSIELDSDGNHKVSEIIYLYVEVDEEASAENTITINAKSKLDPSKSDSKDVYYGISDYKYPLSFDIITKGSLGSLSIAAPTEHVKTSFNMATDTIHILFDPKPTEAESKEFSIDIIDKDTRESQKIPLRLSSRWSIIATDFDVSHDAYNFANSGNVCAGMAETSILYFNNKRNLIPSERPPIDAYTSYNPLVMEKIKKHNEVWNHFVENKKLQLGIVDISKAYEDISYILSNNKQPAMVGLLFGEVIIGDLHAVVAYKTIKIDNLLYIVVYDPNYPYKSDSITSLDSSYPVIIYNIKTNDISYSSDTKNPIKKFLIVQINSLN